MPKCCINCFHDQELKQLILNDSILGNCTYCGGTDTSISEVSVLSEKFEFLMCVIEPNVDGDKAHTVLNTAFKLFNEKIQHPEKLLSDLLGNNIADNNYSIKFIADVYKDGWIELCEELKHKNRFFLQHDVYNKIFSANKGNSFAPFISVLEQLEKIIEPESDYYRARISDTLVSQEKMGAPPSKIASSGRANPKGISYLYLASNLGTCISEVRPYNGCDIYVSKCKNTVTKRVIDLTTPRKSISIMRFSESEYNEVLSIINLLESFSSELSIPVKPHLSELEYIPTQFLCEYIKSLGNYDGIIFRSSFNKGDNLVFFNEDEFSIGVPEVYQLNGVNLDFSPK
jgi:hypothetical protein